MITRFDFFIGGYFGTSYRVKQAGKHLHIVQYEQLEYFPDREASILLRENAAWEKVCVFLKNADWQSNYSLPVCDGTQWSLSYKMDGVTKRSHGSNDYPKDFTQFLKLLNVLAGPGIVIS